MKIRRSLIALGASALLLVPAAPASAHISQFVVFGDVDCDYTGSECTNFVISGFITCDAGERFLVRARFEDPDPGYVSVGYDRGVCTGSQQTWTADENYKQSGVSDGLCPASWSARARTKEAGVLHDTAQDSAACA